ncbi:guanylate kinase [Mycoplasmopsis synoviae]|uniref:Guanylate kinase n=2 Tax=Mycoplasmopsis synoviae TaxID=2109 RepID=A0A3B0P7D7_MYCSY|nr:guanylate kinase [Mycoplasmopsis synoviae]AKB10902.1 guanylate kinase [Mycoplasmopsis synoviae ATCC 25204]SYV92509.1 guanylate kinase [Mycoplasmopsis synoviae]
MNKKKKSIVIFTGPSGVGKGTVEQLVFNYDELNLSLSCSATTRSPRGGETNGIHYYFISKEEFKDRIKNKKFLEYSFHFDNYYGTLYSELDNIIARNKVPFLEIETNGAKIIAQKMQKLKNPPYNLITIFLSPPSITDIYKRIKNRGTENAQTIKNRVNKAKEELLEDGNFKYVVYNDRPERAAQEIREILHKELDID